MIICQFEEEAHVEHLYAPSIPSQHRKQLRERGLIQFLSIFNAVYACLTGINTKNYLREFGPIDFSECLDRANIIIILF